MFVLVCTFLVTMNRNIAIDGPRRKLLVSEIRGQAVPDHVEKVIGEKALTADVPTWRKLARMLGAYGQNREVEVSWLLEDDFWHVYDRNDTSVTLAPGSADMECTVRAELCSDKGLVYSHFLTGRILALYNINGRITFLPK
jgi:hypothetical protein